MADDGCRSSVVHHDRRAVGGAGANRRVMTATNTTPLVRQRSQNGDDGLEQHKGPVEGEQPGPLAPLVGRLVRSAQVG